MNYHRTIKYRLKYRTHNTYLRQTWKQSQWLPVLSKYLNIALLYHHCLSFFHSLHNATSRKPLIKCFMKFSIFGNGYKNRKKETGDIKSVVEIYFYNHFVAKNHNQFLSPFSVVKLPILKPIFFSTEFYKTEKIGSFSVLIFGSKEFRWLLVSIWEIREIIREIIRENEFKAFPIPNRGLITRLIIDRTIVVFNWEGVSIRFRVVWIVRFTSEARTEGVLCE